MSQLLDEILAYNRQFVENKDYEGYQVSKLPDKRLAVISCMDTRLTELLPAALNCRNGDIKLITNAGALISHPFGSVMRSLMICIYEMGVKEVAVIGHHDCGMHRFDIDEFTRKMIARGVPEERIAMLKSYGININAWLAGFEDPRDSVRETVKLIKNHPLVPQDVLVHGLLIDPSTGAVSPL